MLLLPGVIVSIQAWSNYSQRALESLGGGKGRKSGDNATGRGGAGPAPAVHQGLRAAHPPRGCRQKADARGKGRPHAPTKGRTRLPVAFQSQPRNEILPHLPSCSGQASRTFP